MKTGREVDTFSFEFGVSIVEARFISTVSTYRFIRWREPGSDGRRIHRCIVIGTVQQFKNESVAIDAIVAPRREMNSRCMR
jgi:hypothetical protein